jgi:hypothetical protein
MAPLKQLGSFWLTRSWRVQVLFLALFIIIKFGIDVELRNVQEAYLPGSLIFPEPAGYFSASFGQVIFAKMFSLSSTGTWIASHFAMTIVSLIVVIVLVLRNGVGDSSYSLLVLAGASSIGAMMIAIGKYDVFTFLGGAVLVLSRRNWVALLGALLMALGHPEIAFLASISLILVTYIEPFRKYRLRATFSTLISIFVWASVQVWFAIYGLDGGRISLVPTYFGESISNFLVDPLGQLWSWLGIGWLIVLPVLVVLNRRDRYFAASALILIPTLATLVTADGTRVFAGIVLPSYLLVGIWFALKRVKVSKYSEVVVGTFIVALILLPVSLDRPGWYDGQLRGTIMGVTERILGG